MRSFLRGSLYGVTATTGWIGPQQQQSATGGSSSSATAQYQSSVASNHHHQSTVAVAQASDAPTTTTHHTTTTTTTTSPTSPSGPTPTTPIHFATRATYGGFPIYGAEMSESETATLRAERSIRGRVAKWFDQRGFGFIEDTETQQQYFVHARDLITVEGGQKTLFPGQTVEFEPEQTENGGHAMRVSAVGGAPLQAGTLAPAPASLSKTSQQQQMLNSTQFHPERHVLPSYSDAVVAEGGETAEKTEIKTATVDTEKQEEEKEGESSTNTKKNIVIKTEDGTEITLPQPRLTGTIAHWTADKGYGFVAVVGQEEHFFTHIKDFTCAKPNQSPSMPTSGLEVEFTPSYAANKKRATHVTLPNSSPFEPNVITPNTTAAPSPYHSTPGSPLKQSSSQNHLSALAAAFTAPEKKAHVKTHNPYATSTVKNQQQQQQYQQQYYNANSSSYSYYQQQQPAPQYSQHQYQQNQNPDPLWRSGYTSGFVDGQHHLKKEINNMPIASAPSTTSQQQEVHQKTTTTTTSRTNSPVKTTTSPTISSSSSAHTQQQQRPRSRSPMTEKSPQKQRTTSPYSTGKTTTKTDDLWTQHSSSSSKPNNSSNTLSPRTPNNTPEVGVTATTEQQQPKWASSWGSNNNATTTATTATPTPTSSSQSQQQQQGGRGGFPSFPQRGGFGTAAFGRGRGHGRGL